MPVVRDGRAPEPGTSLVFDRRPDSVIAIFIDHLPRLRDGRALLSVVDEQERY